MKEQAINLLDGYFKNSANSRKRSYLALLNTNSYCHFAFYAGENMFGCVFCNRDEDISDRDAFSEIFSSNRGRTVCNKTELITSDKDVFIKIKTSELTKPEFKTFSYKDLLLLPKQYESHDISNHIEGLTGLCDMDIEYDYNNHDERFLIYTVLSYSQGYSGKYGHKLRVIEYNGEPVCFVETSGKWTNSHGYTFIKGSKHKEFVSLLIDLYKNKDCPGEEVDLESELQIDSTLYDQLASGEYNVHKE